MPIIGDIYKTPYFGMGITLPNRVVIFKLLYDWGKLFIKRQLLRYNREYDAVNRKSSNMPFDPNVSCPAPCARHPDLD